MHIIYAHASSPAHARHTAKLRHLADCALQDHELSRSERDELIAALYETGQISPEDCQIMRHMQEQVWRGEVHLVATGSAP
jgi:hypothetical protein